MKTTAIINGAVTDDPKVCVFDRGYTLGDGLFETIPLYDGKTFLLREHMERMMEGASAIRLSLPVDERKAANAIKQLAQNDARQTARLTVTRGRGPRGYASGQCDSPVWVLTVEKYIPLSAMEWKRGYRLGVSSITKNPDSPLAGIKSTSAMERIMALDKAKETGMDETMVLTTGGYISSCSSANLFWVRDGKLETPSLDCAVLPGVTRAVIMALAGKSGIEVNEGKYRADIIRPASEMFVTNSLIEIIPVTFVDGLFQTTAPGPVTIELTDLYRRLVYQTKTI